MMRCTAVCLQLLFLMTTLTFSQDELVPNGVVTFPFFAEILDSEIYPDADDVVYQVGVGGFMFLDVSTPGAPVLMGRYDPGSIWIRFYNGEAKGDLALGAALEEGLYLLDISNLSNPTLRTTYQWNNWNYEAVVSQGDYAYLAAHVNGVEVVNISDPDNPFHADSFGGLENAWDVFIDGDHLYVADGPGGIKIYSLNNPATPSLVGSVLTNGSAREVTVVNGTAYVASGAAGFDIVDVSNPSNPQLLSNYNSGFGIINHLAVDGDVVFAATWEMVEAVDVSDLNNPLLLATEDTPDRAMGLAAENGRVYVSDWLRFRVFDFTDHTEPDIHIKPAIHDFGYQGDNVPIEQEFQIFNLGESTLNLSDVSANNSNFTLQSTQATIPPGEETVITATFTPSTAGTIFSQLVFTSDDPDEATKEVTVYGGQSRLSIGDVAPGFTLDDLDGNTHTLDQYNGKVVLLAFFASW